MNQQLYFVTVQSVVNDGNFKDRPYTLPRVFF